MATSSITKQFVAKDSKAFEKLLKEGEVKMVTNPVKAIRKKCLECCNNSYNKVRDCEHGNCALYPFRFGKNPYRAKRELTEEQKKAMRDRLAVARESRK